MRERHHTTPQIEREGGGKGLNFHPPPNPPPETVRGRKLLAEKENPVCR